MISKSIIFCGRRVTHACDGKCSKAWGHNGGRPTIQLSDDENDWAYLADDELGEAPIDPGTYEGNDAKPLGAKGPDDINKWCVRECERAWMTPYDRPNAEPELPDFSARFYNIRPHRRGGGGGGGGDSATKLSVDPLVCTRCNEDIKHPNHIADGITRAHALVPPSSKPGYETSESDEPAKSGGEA